MSIGDIVKNHGKKFAVGGGVLTILLGFMITEINSAESKADSAITLATKNAATLDSATKTLEILLQLELAERGIKPDTVWIDTTKDST